MVLQCGLNLSTGYSDSGPSQEVQSKVSRYLCFAPGAAQHELQSDLQMAASCAGLGGAQKRPSCKPKPKPRPPSASARHAWGHLARGTRLLEARCTLFERVLESVKPEPR